LTDRRWFAPENILIAALIVIGVCWLIYIVPD